MTKTSHPIPPAQDKTLSRALVRYAAVQLIQQALQSGSSLLAALQRASQQPWGGRYYAPATIETWWYAHRHEGFAALQSCPRSDKGKKRALDPAATQALIELRLEHPNLTLKALVKELLRRNVLQEGSYSLSTLHRRLTEAGLDRQSIRSGAGHIGGPTKAFEMPLPNLLWMADCMHGPTLRNPGHKDQRTYLFALIDDSSRLCPHAQFYPRERLEYFLNCLRQAVTTRGVPDKLYTDNGPAFRSRHLQIVCANLNIALLHAKPYHAWSKGKIERFFLTLQKLFLATLVFEPVQTLEQLNRRFWKWLESGYHQHPHSSLQDQTPAQRFATLGQALRVPDPDRDLDRLFMMQVSRRVRMDATFSLHAQLWEAPVHLRGQIVTVHFDPIDYRRVELWMEDRLLGRAIPCNKQLNARTYGSDNTHEH